MKNIETKKLIATGLVVGAVVSGTTSIALEVNKIVNENKQLERKAEDFANKYNNATKELGVLKKEMKTKEEEYDAVLTKKEKHIIALENEQTRLTKEVEQLKKKNNTTGVAHFTPNNLKSNSGVGAGDLDKVLAHTGLAGLGSTYVDAEKTYGVNALFLTALTAQESGWGKSNRAITQNNLSGYAVYSDGSAGKSFSSKSASIMATAKLLADDYLNPNGKHYKGGNIYEVNSVYCPNDDYQWASKIKSIAYDLAREINSL